MTRKAQESQEYQDYLSRAGEDDELYYRVKLEASKLLLDHIDDTFTTAVFNGSASLRDAAGQLIESTAKSARRKQTIDDAYFDTLYEDMISLYHLDQIQGVTGKTDLGPLPAGAVWLLAVLGAAWAGILLYLGISFLRRRKSGKIRNEH